jgi:hypothetical protein
MLKDECRSRLSRAKGKSLALDSYRKTIIGLLAITFLLGGVGCFFWPPSSGFGLEWKAACWRFAPIMAILWLAYDDLKRVPRWLLVVLPIAVIVLVRWPKLALLCLPLLAIFAMLKIRVTKWLK